MKKTIIRYNLELANKQTIKMPIGAEILHIGIQVKSVYIYALVDSGADPEDRFFETFATGQEIHYDMGVARRHVGTYQITLGGKIFVGHVFERIN